MSPMSPERPYAKRLKTEGDNEHDSLMQETVGQLADTNQHSAHEQIEMKHDTSSAAENHFKPQQPAGVTPGAGWKVILPFRSAHKYF